ncbi:MAG: BadF/BadG/BcrA/BcrD ATPase family protein [Acidobacteriota bacterium]|nr:BadF/BadG/BcrA/BcrD ATPase family protein [Acidobacteriota bacterium]
MPYVIGIDGGGSKCTAALADGERVLAFYTAGGCNLNSVSFGEAHSSLQQAIYGALARGGVDSSRVRAVCAGVAGAASPQTAAKLKGILCGLAPQATVQVVGDTTIALNSEFADGPGVVCLSGTGSIAFGRNERGDYARAGGWGRFVSDEGSGHWIGQRAIIECLQALDMGRSSLLIYKIMREWKIATREQLVQRCNRDTLPNFSELYPAVLAAANEGDALSGEILSMAATRLARITQNVLRRLWISYSAIDITIAGGVFTSSPQMVKIFTNLVRSERPETRVRLSEREAFHGAIYLANKSLESELPSTESAAGVA